MDSNKTFGSADEFIASVVGSEPVMGVWQCERVASKSFGFRARYMPSTPLWVRTLGGFLLAGFIAAMLAARICQLRNLENYKLEDSFAFRFFAPVGIPAMVVWLGAYLFYWIKDARNCFRVADLLIATPQRLFVVLDIYSNRTMRKLCAGSVQVVEKNRIKLRRRYFSIWTLYLTEPECGFNDAKSKKQMKIERYPVLERKQFRKLMNSQVA